MTTTVNINSSLKINVTPIESGASGGVLFQKSDGKLGQSSNLHWDDTNSRLSIGQGTAPGARVDVRAQGALSTDVAFRVRNSANTQTLFEMQSTGKLVALWNGDTNSTIINGTKSGDFATAIGVSTNAGIGSVALGNNVNTSGAFGVCVGVDINKTSSGASGIGFGFKIMSGGPSGYSFGRNITGNRVGIAIGKDITFSGDDNATHFIGFGLTDVSGFMESKVFHTFGFGSYGTSGNKPGLTYRSNNLNQLLLGFYSTDANYSTSTGTNWIAIKNGTAPGGAVDAFQFYSADIVAGNAAPHFRTENGSVIKLYKQDLATSPTTAQIATLLSNLGLANLI